MQRALSLGRKKHDSDKPKDAPKHHFSLATLRGIQQPEMSKKLYKLIKTENHAIEHYEQAGRERISIASQLSDWGEASGDDSLSEISDKLGVLLSEIGEQEEGFAASLDDYRAVLKQIRNTEASVQPSRDHKQKITDEIAKLKYKEPESVKIPQLEQELVRAEAQNLVAEAQLTNITRQKFKEAYDLHTAATIERAEKQLILAKHARRLLNLLDDTPIVPGDARPAFAEEPQARQVLIDAEEDLREWTPGHEIVKSHAAGMGTNLMPTEAGIAQIGDTSIAPSETGVASAAAADVRSNAGSIGQGTAGEGGHLAQATGSTAATDSSVAGSSTAPVAVAAP